MRAVEAELETGLASPVTLVVCVAVLAVPVAVVVRFVTVVMGAVEAGLETGLASPVTLVDGVAVPEVGCIVIVAVVVEPAEIMVVIFMFEGFGVVTTS